MSRRLNWKLKLYSNDYHIKPTVAVAVVTPYYGGLRAIFITAKRYAYILRLLGFDTKASLLLA